MPDTVLLREITGFVGTLKFNRPAQGNALSADLLMAVYQTLKQWRETEAVRCVVITGNSDKAFSAGYDIAAIPTQVSPELAELLKAHNPLELALNAVKDFPYPVIAMINGYCFGAGLNLAMCCDIRIAADHIKAGMPPVKLGLVYHPQGLSQFVEAIGMARTREIFLTGHTYAGTEILTMGLADHLVPAAVLSESVYAMAQEISQNAPLSLKGTKKILNMIGKYALIRPDDLPAAEALIAEAFNSEDLKEGQRAFLEKRTPVFTGK